MLGTFIEKLQALLSKSFLIAGFFPILIAAAMNGALLYTQSAAFQAAVGQYLRDDKGLVDSATTGAAVLAALSIVAFVFSMINTRLREVLEGRVLWPRLLAGPFVWRQTSRRDRLQRLYEEAQKERSDLQRDRPRWESRLLAARRTPKPAHAPCHYPWFDRTALRIRVLRIRRSLGWHISRERLKADVTLLEAILRTAAVDNPEPADVGASKRLDKDQVGMLRFVDYAVSRNSNRAYQLSGEIQFSFSGDALAPTAMGNIAQSIPSYTFTRYRMNIDLFWTRLQKVMVTDSFNAVLQDAKTQLDFLVSLWWLIAATMVGWLPYLALRSHDLWPFLVLAVAGPLALTTVYSVGVQNYRAFADLMRAAVDLYRLDLLKALNLPAPVNSASEAEVWALLNSRMSYGNTTSVTYEQAAKSS